MMTCVRIVTDIGLEGGDGRVCESRLATAVEALGGTFALAQPGRLRHDDPV